MTRPTLLLTLFLIAAPALASAQQQPPRPPRDSARPRQLQPMRARAPLAPQGRFVPGAWIGPGGQFVPGWMGPRGFVPRGRMAPFAPQAPRAGFARPPRPGAPGEALLAPRLREQLNLTADQVRRLEAIREEIRGSHQKLLEQARTERRERMEAQRTELRQLQEERRKLSQDAQERMRQVLTAEQQKQLEALRQRAGRGRLPQ